MLRKLPALLLALALILLAVSGCGKSPESQLKDLGYVLTPQDFLRSITRRDFQAVKLFLDAKQDPNTRDTNGIPFLIHAVDSGEINTVRILIDRKADVNAQSINQQITPLLIACQKKNPEIASVLLSSGSDPNSRAKGGLTPLMAAAHSDSPELIEMLLAKGADINAQSDIGETALMIAAGNDRYVAVKKLIQRGAEVNLKSKRGWTALNYADGYDRVILRLLCNGAQYANPRQKPWFSPNDMVKRFFEAVASGSVSATRSYIDAGVDPAVPYANRESAITIAARTGNTALVKLLLDEGANVDSEYVYADSNPLIEAVTAGNIEMATFLLDRGAKIDYMTQWGDALCHAVWNNHTAMVGLLLSRGAEIDPPGEYTMTPLMDAVTQGHVEMVKFLISKGAKLNRVTRLPPVGDRDYTALGLAELRGHTEIADIIKKAGGK